MLKPIGRWLLAAGLGTTLPLAAGVPENRPLSPKCSFRSAGPSEDFSRYGLRILSLWVSHGDATLMRLPSGEIALIDSGQDFAVKDYLVPFLQQHGIKELDYFIVTHYHGDHYAGKIEKDGKVYVGYRYDEASPRIPVKHFWDNRTFRRGDEFNWGGTRMFILNSAYTNEWSDDENHRSLSFRMEYKGFTYALGGDIYAQEQERIPYASTAQMEYESVAPGPFDIVELNHIREMYTLVNFDAVVRELDILLFPESLSARVNSSPVFGAWKYQPFPLSSQLLGNWLRLHASSKFDGLFFRSTKDPHGTNFFIFAPSDWVIA